MGNIPNTVSDGFLQIMEAMRIVFVDSTFHCFPQIKIRGGNIR
jgi:hypothetical protein